MPVDEEKAPCAAVVFRDLQLSDSARTDEVHRVVKRDEVVVDRRLVREKPDVEVIHDILGPLRPGKTR